MLPERDGAIVSHYGYRDDEEKGATPDPLMGVFPLNYPLPQKQERAPLDLYLAKAGDYIDPVLLPISLVAVPLVLFARFLSVGGPVLELGRWQHFVEGTIPVLTWGGGRGGISVALALSLPESAARSAILAATYAVVVFTLVVHGLTLAPAVRHTAERTGE